MPRRDTPRSLHRMSDVACTFGISTPWAGRSHGVVTGGTRLSELLSAPSTGRRGRSSRERGSDTAEPFPPGGNRYQARAAASQRGAQAAMRRGVRWCAGTSVLRRLPGSLERSGLRPHSLKSRLPARAPRARGGLPACIRTRHYRRPPPLRSSGLHRAAYRMHASGVAATPRARRAPRARGGAASTAHAPRGDVSCPR